MLKSTSHWDTNFKFQYVWEKKKNSGSFWIKLGYSLLFKPLWIIKVLVVVVTVSVLALLLGKTEWCA